MRKRKKRLKKPLNDVLIVNCLVRECIMYSKVLPEGSKNTNELRTGDELRRADLRLLKETSKSLQQF